MIRGCVTVIDRARTDAPDMRGANFSAFNQKEIRS